jgi:hypothetical protein
MKQIIFRFAVLFTALALGTMLFVGLLYAGDKSKGPLQDIFSNVRSEVAQMEKKLLDPRESRSQSLLWFNQFRNNAAMINSVDTLLLGAYDDATYESFENIVALEDSLKTKLPVISIYTAWGSKKDQVFPQLRAQAIYDLGSIPMITWEPWLNDFDPQTFSWNAGALNKNKGGLKAIAEGKYDAYIDKWALDARKFGLPFYLRWGHEMNDPYRYPWGQQNNGSDDYIHAWQHVVKRFRALGAKNAVWVWSPHPAYTFSEFYPGNEYVDWVGLTALNYGSVATWSRWWSFGQIIGNAYKGVASYNKPVMLTEFGCLTVGGDRAQWFREAFASLPREYPKIKAVIFFHAAGDATVSYKSLDWSFESDVKVLNSVRKSINH